MQFILQEETACMLSCIMFTFRLVRLSYTVLLNTNNINIFEDLLLERNVFLVKYILRLKTFVMSTVI